MLYVDLHDKTDKKLVLLKNISDNLAKKDIYPIIYDALEVSHKLQDNITLFLERKHTLSEVACDGLYHKF